MEEFFSWENFVFFLPKVLKQLPTTLSIVFVATLFGTGLGFLFAVIKKEKIPILSQIINIFISFFRGTSILIQVFLIFFGLPLFLQTIGLNITSVNKLFIIYLAYSLNTASYLSITFSSAMGGVPRGQIEAAKSLNFKKKDIYKHIIIPQSIKIAIPDYATQITTLLHDTAVAFTIGIIDVMGIVKSMSVMVSSQVEGYLAASLVFIVFSFLIDFTFRFIDQKFTFGKRMHKGA